MVKARNESVIELWFLLHFVVNSFLSAKKVSYYIIFNKGWKFNI